MNVTQVHVTLENLFLPLYDPLGKVIEVTFQSCPIAFPLDITNNTCACMPELEKTPTITCDVNTQTITRHGECRLFHISQDEGTLSSQSICTTLWAI